MELKDLELGKSWECEPLRLGGVDLALQNKTIKEAPTSNTYSVCTYPVYTHRLLGFRLMPWALGVLQPGTEKRRSAVIGIFYSGILTEIQKTQRAAGLQSSTL